MPNRKIPRAPNMGKGINHAKNLRRSAPVRVGLNKPTNTVGVRVVGDYADPIGGKAVTGVAATDLFTATAHGYVAGNTVKFSALTGGTGIVAGQRYYILATGLTANDFKVSAQAPNQGVAQPVLDFSTDLTAGTVTRQLPNSYAGTPELRGKQESDGMPIPGPRKG